MTIKNLKELEAAIKLCRKHGVDTMEIGNIKLCLGDAPVEPAKASELKTEDSDTKEDNGVTDEQMLFWSSQ